ncbi:unnamed protein product [Mytilus edulis]|uniref:Endonuclease/exonuclease/phosphatase domain-containing protein n=1 Tax=Mytilus edulis TaxID=6550 RepID=A0A8S3TJQ3_MYTED|nr:unnamed protein product [Mytilus edulis]
MLSGGNTMMTLLSDDKYHLNDKGTSILANNLKHAIHSTLNITIQRNRSRSRSRNTNSRQVGRGRGRGHADILLCGDFNARAGSHPDLIIQDEIDFLPLYNTYPLDKNIMLRKNRDKKLDCRGKDLCEFCISHQLRILNGRTLGDLNGNFTCYTPNGASVVDYSIVSESALDYILYFRVAEFVPTLSDCHCKIEWEMSAQFSANLRDDCIDHDLHTMPSRYMWSENSVTVFQEALTSPSVLEKYQISYLKGILLPK